MSVSVSLDMAGAEGISVGAGAGAVIGAEVIMLISALDCAGIGIGIVPADVGACT